MSSSMSANRGTTSEVRQKIFLQSICLVYRPLTSHNHSCFAWSDFQFFFSKVTFAKDSPIPGYYERCCGRLHNSNLPLNLEMINNNHDQDFKTRCGEYNTVCTISHLDLVMGLIHFILHLSTMHKYKLLKRHLRSQRAPILRVLEAFWDHNVLKNVKCLFHHY